MKFKLVFSIFLIAIALNSCSIDDGDTPNINFEAIPVTNVEMPQSFTFGERHEIPVMFNFTNDCQRFAGFEVRSNLNERIITVVASSASGGCVEEIISAEQTLNFLAASNGSYVFKFFNGFDTSNEPTYLEYTVVVEE